MVVVEDWFGRRSASAMSGEAIVEVTLTGEGYFDDLTKNTNELADM